MKQTIKTACRACHGGCGALVTVEDGVVTDLRPDPDSPLSKGRMCPKGLAGIELLYSPDRLKYPMIREGERGEGKWRRVSWDEALNYIVENVNKIRNESGPEAIVLGQGTGRHHLKHVNRFANALGTPNWMEPGTAQCFFPRVATGNLTYGTMPVMDYYGDVNPELILVWGSNPIISGADAEIQFRCRDAVQKGSRLIVVDPRRTELAEKAEYWLQLRPGTDDALAMGFLNVIIGEELYDKEFCEKWVYGLDKLAERVKEFTPKRVSEITWVPEEKIIAAARLFAATKPAGLEWGCALEHTPNCFQTVRALAILPGITGNFDIPGGWIEGAHVMPEADILIDKLPDEQGYKRIGESRYKLLAGVGGECPASHVPSLMKAMLEGDPYQIRGLMLFGNNGIISFADSQKVRKAYENMEFISCMDLFMTPTAEMADVVLPAASWLELDEVYSGPSLADHVILVQKKVAQIGECRCDEEVLCELAKRLELNYYADSIYDIYNDQLKSVAEKYPEYHDLDWEKMKELSYLEFPIEYKQYEKRGRFNTPTGKMEVWSTAMEDLGLDPLPNYVESPESPYSTPELYSEYPLILTTGARSKYYFISEGRQIPRLRRRSMYPEVEIHPEDAEKYGIVHGDWVFIETKRGRITMKANVTDGILQGVVSCPIGWWYPEESDTGHGWNESNCNVLTSQDPPYDPNSGTYQLRGLLCRIYKNTDCNIEQRFEQSELYTRVKI